MTLIQQSGIFAWVEDSTIQNIEEARQLRTVVEALICQAEGFKKTAEDIANDSDSTDWWGKECTP